MNKKIISITLAITAAAVISGCVENNKYYSDTQSHRSNRYNAAPPSTTSGFYMGDPQPMRGGYQSSTGAPPSTTSQPVPAPVPASDTNAPPSTTSSANTSGPAGNGAPPSGFSSSTN